MSRRTLALVLAGFACIAAPGAGGAEPRVAVLPVVVHSLDDHEYLRGGLADMLTSRLERVPGIAVLRVDDRTTATMDLETARATASARGADYVVFGSFTHFGASASLDVHCAPVAVAQGDEGSERQVFIHAGQLGDVIPELDELSEKLARFVLGAAAESMPAAAPDGAQNGQLDELRRRVDALENAVFTPAPEDVAEVDLSDAPVD